MTIVDFNLAGPKAVELRVEITRLRIGIAPRFLWLLVIEHICIVGLLLIDDTSYHRPRDRSRTSRQAMSTENRRSPAARVMDEAIDLAIAGRSPYPDRAAFVDADSASAGQAIKRATLEGL